MGNFTQYEGAASEITDKPELEKAKARVSIGAGKVSSGAHRVPDEVDAQAEQSTPTVPRLVIAPPVKRAEIVADAAASDFGNVAGGEIGAVEEAHGFLSDDHEDVEDVPTKETKKPTLFVGTLKTKDLDQEAHGSPRKPTEEAHGFLSDDHEDIKGVPTEEAHGFLSDDHEDIEGMPTKEIGLLSEYRYELEFEQAKHHTAVKVTLRARDGSRFKLYIGRYKVGKLTGDQIQRSQLKTLPNDVREVLRNGEISDELIDHLFSRPGKGSVDNGRPLAEDFPQDGSKLDEVWADRNVGSRGSRDLHGEALTVSNTIN